MNAISSENEIENSPESNENDLFNIPELPEDVLDALGPGRFTDISFISSGATSSVFSAHDTNLDKTVAIKLLSHANEHKLINFQGEAKTACKLNHKNIVKTLNFGVTRKNDAYLIMDFVKGQSLESVIQEHGHLPVKQAIQLFMQICDGMIHSHEKKIVHRDLKTANIVVQNYGKDDVNVIVVDFGLARERQSKEHTQGSSGGNVKGSPLFISPEQAKGLHGDERSDIYSLGCIVFRALTGKWVFTADDLFELLRKHVEEPPPQLNDVAPDLEFDPMLEQLVKHMLEKDPDRRYQTTKEVREAFAQIQAEFAARESGAAKHDVQLAPPAPPRRIRAQLFYTLVVTVALMMVGSTWFFLQNNYANIHTAEKKKRTESRPMMLDRLFRVESTAFMSHLDKTQYIVKDSTLLEDSDLVCFDGTALQTPNINMSYAVKLSGEGLAHLSQIRGLNLELNFTKFTEAGYRTLGSLENLEGVALGGTNVANEQWEYLAKLPRLKEVGLDQCEFLDDNCVKTISQCRSLHTFVARDKKTKLTDKSIEHLSHCPALEFLQIDGADITDEGLKPILQHKQMADLRLNRCNKLTGKSLRAIVDAFPNLHLLGFGFTNVKTEDLTCLAKLKKIEFLEIPGVPIYDEQMKMFGQMNDLKWLYLSDVKCTEKGLRYLYPLRKQLRKLVWMKIDISKNALDELKANLPTTNIVFPGRVEQVDDHMSDMLDMMKD